MSHGEPLDAIRAALGDHYRIEREAGAGGMATVYLAEDLRHHRKVAVKVLKPDLAASMGAERFLREIGIAAALQHPHILPLYDSGEADGFLYYVMPYVEGASLRNRLEREGALPIADAVRILRDIADALAAAHRHRVVHRDIKPENVMLSGKHALVTDFGVAKAVSEATGGHALTSVGVALGTPAYMAPEQATADPSTDHRADIYAFGVVAYELLGGRPPFQHATMQGLIAAHLTVPPERLSVHRSAVPPALEVLVMQCLEKRAADRPQSADDILSQLEALPMSGAMTPTGMAPATMPVSRRRVPALAWVALAAVVGIGGWWATRAPGVALDDTLVLALPFRVSATAQLGATILSTGNLKTLASGPRWARFGALVPQLSRLRGYGDFVHYHLLARGALDVVVESDVNILDIAALTVIVEEAGGRFTDLDGGPVGLDTTTVLASNGVLHDKVLEALR